VALGLASLFGIRLTINFLFPYTAVNIREFWQKWHVTLSGWFRDYVYFPLGGGRVPWVAANVLIVFGISGLWHGAGWNFVAWGLYHGLLITVYMHLSRFVRVGRVFAWGINYGAVMFGWLFFMETNSGVLLDKLARLADFGSYSIDGFVQSFLSDGLVAIAVFAVTLALAHGELVRQYLAVRYDDSRSAYLPSLRIALLFLAATFLLTAREQSQFVYFAF